MLFCGLVCLVVFRNLPFIRNCLRLVSVSPFSLVRNVCCLAAVFDQSFLTRCSFRLTCFTCFTCCKGILCGCGFLFLWFVCLWFLVAFVWFSLCLFFPLLPACLSSFTDWCLVHRQQSREQKRILTCYLFRVLYPALASASGSRLDLELGCRFLELKRSFVLAA